MRVFPFFLVLAILFGNCGQTKKPYEGTSSIYEETYPGGKKKLNIISHTDGGLKIDTIKEYYENGNLQGLSTMINKKQDGESVEYFESGKIKRKNNWKKGEMFSADIGYYESGKVHFYNMYDLEGKIFYKKHWKIDNEPVDSGKIIAPLFHINTTTNSFKVNQKVLFPFLIADPPDSKSEIKGAIEEYSKTRTPVFETINSTNNIANYSPLLQFSGTYTLVVVGVLRDRDGKYHRADTVRFKVNVTN